MFFCFFLVVLLFLWVLWGGSWMFFFVVILVCSWCLCLSLVLNFVLKSRVRFVIYSQSRKMMMLVRELQVLLQLEKFLMQNLNVSVVRVRMMIVRRVLMLIYWNLGCFVFGVVQQRIVMINIMMKVSRGYLVMDQIVWGMLLMLRVLLIVLVMLLEMMRMIVVRMSSMMVMMVISSWVGLSFQNGWFFLILQMWFIV